MARTATHIQATVQPGLRIEFAAPPGLREGDTVEVLLLCDQNSRKEKRSVMEILDSLPRGVGTFTSADEVDKYIREERESWEP